MSQAAPAATSHSSASANDRLHALEAELRSLSARSLEHSTQLEAMASVLQNAGQKDQLSMVVFSGSLDRLIAAFVLATGAAAMGMKVAMFFTFWGTSALRRPARVKKSPLERMFGWMLPRGARKLPLSQMNMAGGGPAMIRHIMKKKGVASVEEMIELSKELGVEINVCSMSMDLLGLKPEELIDYPAMTYCGAAKFLETAAPGKITLFL
ncbi:MAG TPA: DsrE/DsrF/DrsH-like family protein [Polyangiaceae bacterium]|nr:DsrE/DsrF/DrsH-like family protein [Polyangiaceae bacterium]